MCLVGGASETGSRDSGNRVEDRLTSLEADLAHSTAATDAMSSIIDQVIVIAIFYIIYMFAYDMATLTPFFDANS